MHIVEKLFTHLTLAVFALVFYIRSCAEEALRNLNGTQLGGQNIRLSWGRSPSNKEVLFVTIVF